MPEKSITLWLTANEAYGKFCCGDKYDAASKTCKDPTLGSDEPFQLPPGQFIHDRVTGSTEIQGSVRIQINSTAIVTRVVSSISTAITTVTAEATQNNGKKVTVAVAVGTMVPLGVLLLASVLVTALLWSRLTKLQRKNEAWAKSRRAGMAELGQDQAVHEASPSEPRYELANSWRPVEVPGSLLQTRGYL